MFLYSLQSSIENIHFWGEGRVIVSRFEGCPQTYRPVFCILSNLTLKKCKRTIVLTANQ